MEVNEQKVTAAKDCFAFNPALNTIFVTGDLSCFPNRSNAVNHARGLDDKEIDVFIRDEDEAVIDADQTDDVTEESFTIPDARLAVVKAAGGKGKNFEKVLKPVVEPDPAIVVDPAATVVDPAATVTDPAIVVDPAATVVDPAATVVDPAATVTDPNITDKLTELVSEVEELLHLNTKKA